MEGGWPSLPKWLFEPAPSRFPSNSISACQDVSPYSSSGPRPNTLAGSADLSSQRFTGEEVYKSSFTGLTPKSGKAAIGGGLVAVLQAAGGLLRILGRGTSSKSQKRVPNSELERQTDIKATGGLKNLRLSTAGGIWANTGQGTSRGHAASALLNRVTSLILGRFEKFRDKNGLHTIFSAFIPHTENLGALLLPAPVGGITEENFRNGADISGSCLVGKSSQEANRQQWQHFKRLAADDLVVEPKTGVQFPLRIAFDDNDDKLGGSMSTCQVLAGMGARSKSLVKVKSIMIYAFALYVQPDDLRAQLGKKYGEVPPEELKYRSDFYNDLLSQGVDMTVRLVVHYKGLKMAMVRSYGQLTVLHQWVLTKSMKSNELL